MKAKVEYEWNIETFNTDEHEDIIDNYFSDHLTYTKDDFEAAEGEAKRLVLIRNEGDESDGLQDRFWAYVKDGNLPEYFSDSSGHEISIKVPVKYHNDLKKFLSK